MPAEFDKAIQSGARVRTKKLKGGRYIHLAYLNGKSYASEVHKKKKK